jgi:hypothetical protein
MERLYYGAAKGKGNVTYAHAVKVSLRVGLKIGLDLSGYVEEKIGILKIRVMHVGSGHDATSPS